MYQPELKDDGLARAIRDVAADVLVVRGTAVTAHMLESGALSLVVRAGAGVNTIDVPAASARGIYVSNCPGKNAIAVAELAFALMLALDRRIVDNVADLRAGRWNKKEYSHARGLYGRTLGLLGYGNIAQEMAKRAHAFGMPIVVWSRRFFTGRAGVEEAAVPLTLAKTPQEVAATADVLSVHLALTADTRGLVNASILDRLKPGSYFINTARAEVVDYAALEKVARERGIRVALDVYAAEPADATEEFKESIVALPNVYGTHHIGASTEQAQEAIALETVRIVTTYKRHGQGSQRRESGKEDAGHAQADCEALRSARRPRACLQPPARRQHQRAGNRECRLRRRAGGRRPHQPRRRSLGRAAEDDPERQQRHPRFACCDDLTHYPETRTQATKTRKHGEDVFLVSSLRAFVAAFGRELS